MVKGQLLLKAASCKGLTCRLGAQVMVPSLQGNRSRLAAVLLLRGYMIDSRMVARSSHSFKVLLGMATFL